jgi:FkbM family methyltransferase
MVSWSQNREDIVLWRALGDIEAGTYVDVGAADPEHDSVTKLFYDCGWSGLNVEPVATYADRLSVQRERDITVQACAGAGPGQATLHRFENTGLSSLDGDAARRATEAGYLAIDEVVEVLALGQILNDADFSDRDIHFLKIDVEGFEREVLLGLDLSIWRPWVIVVEATAPNSTEQVHDKWEPGLLDAGYVFCLFDGINRFYVAAERASMLPALSYPACSLDSAHISVPHRQALAAYDELLLSTQTLERELVETQQAYERQGRALDESTTEHDRLQAIYQEALAGYERQELELTSMHKSKAALLASNGELIEERARLADECSTLRDGVRQMAEEIDELRRSVRAEEERGRDTQAALSQMTSSTSWRLTRPIRQMADTVKGVMRRTAP